MTSRLSLALALLFTLAGCRGDAYGDKADYGEKPLVDSPNATDAPEASGGFTSQDLVGTWQATASISPEQAAMLSDEPVEPGTEVSATLNGEIDYLAGGTYTNSVDSIFLIKASGATVRLNFRLEQTGTWELDGDILTETVQSQNVTPLDAETTELFSLAPELSEGLGGVGDVSVSTISPTGPNALLVVDEETGVEGRLRRAG